MTRADLVNTIKQGKPITAKLVSEILVQLDRLGYMEANLKYYMAECQRLEDILAAKEG